MNEPLSECCNAPFDENGYCMMCGQDGFIETEEEEEESDPSHGA